jgi:membrane-anchored protein YejM (alkaline phosphatase superfamily)
MKKKNSYKLWFIFLGLMIMASLLFLLSGAISVKGPNIIFITIDALRPDHLGCYGYKRDTSPNIDKLAKEGVLFSKCFATSSGQAILFPVF